MEPSSSSSSSSSSPGSLKKVKALGSMTQVFSCLVDGCNSDLSRCRDYHRQHKVCELHSKTRKVTIKGQEQRFCQQCSRSAAQNNTNSQLGPLGFTNSLAPETSSFCQQLLQPNSAHGINQIEFLDRLHPTANSNGAPSLLSSQQIETSVAASNHMVHPNPGPFPQTRQLVTDTGGNISTPHYEGAHEHGPGLMDPLKVALSIICHSD